MHRLPSILAAATLSLTLAAGLAHAEPPASGAGTFVPKRMERTPDEFQGIGVNERLNAALPLDASFVDESGNTVRLGDYFRSGSGSGGGKPVILQLGYLSCPMLCDLVSQGTADSLVDLDLALGKDYEVLFISIDPSETPQLAAKKKQTFLGNYALHKHLEGDDLKTASAGWHFLTGDDNAIRAVAQATGFQYKYIDAAKQYSHPAVITLVTPAGQVGRYLYGVKFDPKTLRLSLVETSAGKVGSVMDQILLVCFHVGPDGKYTLAATRLMQFGGLLTIFCLGSTLGVFAIRSRFTRGLPPRSRGLSAVMAGGPGAAAGRGAAGGPPT